MLQFFFVISVLMNVSLIYGAFNLLKKHELFEDYFAELQVGLSTVLDRMRAVDIRGSFESDDEVGDVFKTMQGLVESLDSFVSQNQE